MIQGIRAENRKDWAAMTLNKKQKKQIEVARKKLSGVQKQLSGAKAQMDDPAEVRRLTEEVATLEAHIARIQESGG